MIVDWISSVAKVLVSYFCPFSIPLYSEPECMVLNAEKKTSVE